MRRFRAWLVVVASVALPSVASVASAGEPLRLEDAIQLALTNNERAQKAPLRVETAAGQLDRARTAFLPSLSAQANATLRSEEDREGSNWSTSGTLTLTQPIINPSAFPLYSQSKRQLESEKWGAAGDKRLVGFDTARAFMQALAAERVLEAANRRLDRAKANFAQAEARSQTGLAGSNDVTRAQLDSASSARDVANAQGTVARAYLQLSFLVGQKVTGPLAVADRTNRAAEQYPTTGVPADLRAAPDRRPDVRAARERTESLRAAAKEPMYRLIPSLSASAQVRVVPSPIAPAKPFDETVQLTLTWNIFDAGSRYADKRSRSAQAESQALDEHLLRRSVDNDVGLALATLRAARESFKIADEALVVAQKNTEETEVLYRQGLARAIELIDANARRFDAEVARATARLSLQQAYLELRFALGFGPLEEGPR